MTGTAPPLSTLPAPQGDTVAVGGEHAWRRAVSPTVAATLGRAMARTVSEGTGFHGFHDEAGRAYLEGVTVGGKTGTAHSDNERRPYAWFTAYARSCTSPSGCSSRTPRSPPMTSPAGRWPHPWPKLSSRRCDDS